MTLAKTLSIGILIILGGSALAAGPQSPATDLASQNTPETVNLPQLTTLQVSPMYVEIKEVMAETALQEAQLLRDLAAAEAEPETQQIIKKIEKLDLDRDLKILRIQARYAHQGQRWGLEKQIRHRIRKIEEGSLLAVK